MSMKVLVYRKCSTCMKALKWLDEHNINYEERAIKEENPTYEELKKWYAKSGLPLKKFFNTGGTTVYKRNNRTTYTRITGVKPGTYTLRVRPWAKINGRKAYGDWVSWGRRIRVK